MWPLEDDLTKHFEKVKQNRLSGTRDDDDDEPSDGVVVHNEYARGRGRAR